MISFHCDIKSFDDHTLKNTTALIMQIKTVKATTDDRMYRTQKQSKPAQTR